MVSKEHILDEIRRTASANGGAPLGMRTFERETGVAHADWFGVHWRSWGDAVREAGRHANALTGRIDEERLFERYARFTRELGRRPVKGDVLLMRRRDRTFPAYDTLARRFGSFADFCSRARDWCSRRREFADVTPFLQAPIQRGQVEAAATPGLSNGFVYLIKHGSRSEYKIGRTLNPVRREGEMRLQLPERVEPVHYIETDDPAGVEAYWHARFAAKRKEGEWFALAAADVQAFRKWKRIPWRMLGNRAAKTDAVRVSQHQTGLW